MKAKKYLVMLLTVVIMVSIVGCGSNSKTETAKTTDSAAKKDINWPKRTITINVGFNAGGDSDYYARVLARSLEKVLKTNVVVVNTAGVNGQVCARGVLGMDPDGYNCYFGQTVSLWQESTNLVKDFSFINDFKFGGTIVQDKTFCFYMRPDLGIKNMKDLEKYTIAHPNTLKLGASFGGLGEYMLAQLERNSKITFDQIDVGSSATDMITAMLNGTLDINRTNYGNITDYIKTGQFICLGIAADERCPYLPNVPTLKEQGYDANATKYYFINWPKKTDDAIVKKFNDAMKQVSEMPEFKEAITRFNGEVMFKTPEEHKAFATNLVNKMKSVATPAKTK